MVRHRPTRQMRAGPEAHSNGPHLHLDSSSRKRRDRPISKPWQACLRRTNRSGPRSLVAPAQPSWNQAGRQAVPERAEHGCEAPAALLPVAARLPRNQVVVPATAAPARQRGPGRRCPCAIGMKKDPVRSPRASWASRAKQAPAVSRPPVRAKQRGRPGGVATAKRWPIAAVR